MKKILKAVLIVVGVIFLCKGGFQVFHSILNPPIEQLLGSVDIFKGMGMLVLGGTLMSATLEISEAR